MNKLFFLFKKPVVIIVTGKGKNITKEAIFHVLSPFFKIGKEVLIFEAEDREIEKYEFFLKNSCKPVLVITHIGDIPFDKNFFAGEKENLEKTTFLAKNLPSQTNLILNFDDETVREIDDVTNLKTTTFGFGEMADFRATDLKLNMGINFKVNFKGNLFPIWLERVFGKKQVYAALAAIVVGTIFDLNLVEISQNLKNYKSLPGELRLIEGIKNSYILDDSESATVFSMVEAIEILGKINWAKRKIAVLGDITGIGKYIVETHEALGEKVAINSNLLFTFGPRTKFIAQEAIKKGMSIEKIFQFDKIEEGIPTLKNEIKDGDLILVDGSREIKMEKILTEIMAPSSSG